MRTKNLSNLTKRKRIKGKGYIDYGVKLDSYPYNSKSEKIIIIQKSAAETRILVDNSQPIIEVCIGHDSDTSISYYLTYPVTIDHINNYYENKDVSYLIPEQNEVTEKVYQGQERVYHIVLRHADGEIVETYKVNEGDFKVKQFRSFSGYQSDKNGDDLNWECWEKEKLEAFLDSDN